MSDLTQADRYLLDAVRSGSGDGWQQLVDRYQGRLLAFARHKLRGGSDADDLVQDTFVSFLKALPDFREQASLETFLFVILRRKIMSYYRGRQTGITLLQDSLTSASDQGNTADRLPAPDLTASSYARRAETHRWQRDALADALREVIDGYKSSLNFRDLQIIEMLFFAQLRNRDIATIAGVAENHVAVLKHRALKQIRVHVEDHDARRRERDPAVTAGGGDEGTDDPPDALLSEIWQEQRLNCVKRSTIGSFLLGTLEEPWAGYVAFHLDRLGCRFCRANLDDLRRQTADDGGNRLRERILQSTVGFLRRD